ncbi:stAR-related lipid transfer protein 5-like [Saccoglossus kowalevskii]
MTDYRALADIALEKVLSYASDGSGWIFHKNTDGIKLYYRPSPEFNGILYKTDFIFNASPKNVYDFTRDMGLLQKLNNNIEETQILEMMDDMAVTRFVLASQLMGLVSPREFINVVSWKEIPEQNAYTVYNNNVEHASYPIVPEFVRGTTYPSGRLLYPVEGEPNKCRVIGFSQSDIKLSPQTLVDKFAPGMIIGHIKKTMKLINTGQLCKA